MSATWYGVSVQVRVDFTSGPWVDMASLSWSDITNDVRSISISRGRTSELSTYSPGSVTMVLANGSRAYDPANTAGPYYGLLKPRRRVQVLLAGTVVFTGFVAAWLLEWPEAGKDATATCTATDGFDVLSGARLPGSAYEAEVLALEPDYYWSMQDIDSQGEFTATCGPDPVLGRSTELGGFERDTTPTLPIGGADAGRAGVAQLSGLATTVAPKLFSAWVTNPGSSSVEGGGVVFYYVGSTKSDVMRVAVYDRVIKVFYSDSADAVHAPLVGSAGWEILTDRFADVTTHLEIVADATTLTIYADGTLWQTITLDAGASAYGSATTGTVGGYMTKSTDGSTVASMFSHPAWWAATPGAFTAGALYLAGAVPFGHPYGERGGARIGRILDAVGWPAADRELSAGETPLGDWLPANSDALTACRAIETADQGMFFMGAGGKVTFRSRQDTWTTTRCITAQATFGDGAGETPTKYPLRYDASSLDYMRNVVSVSYPGGTVTVENATSVTNYGEAPDSVNANILRTWDGWVARQLAAFRLRLRATPTGRVPAVAVGTFEDDGTASTHVATLKGLELGDRVRVIRRPNGSTDPIDLQVTLQGVRWTITPQSGFQWQGYVSPAAPSYTEAPYWVVGDATYGTIGSGNLISF